MYHDFIFSFLLCLWCQGLFKSVGLSFPFDLLLLFFSSLGVASSSFFSFLFKIFGGGLRVIIVDFSVSGDEDVIKERECEVI